MPEADPMRLTSISVPDAMALIKREKRLQAQFDELGDRINDFGANLTLMREVFATADKDPAATEIFRPATDHLRRVGQVWREELMQSTPEMRAFIEQIPESAWTAAAARTLVRLIEDGHRQPQENERG